MTFKETQAQELLIEMLQLRGHAKCFVLRR